MEHSKREESKKSEEMLDQGNLKTNRKNSMSDVKLIFSLPTLSALLTSTSIFWDDSTLKIWCFGVSVHDSGIQPTSLGLQHNQRFTCTCSYKNFSVLLCRDTYDRCLVSKAFLSHRSFNNWFACILDIVMDTQTQSCGGS